MKTLSFSLSVFLFIQFSLINLNGQSIQELDNKKGFQDIKLGSKFASYNDFVPMTYEQHGRIIKWNGMGYDYIYSGSKYKRIGDVKIEALYIKVTNGLIEEIKVRCVYDQILFSVIRAKYGEPLSKYERKDNENSNGINGHEKWESENFELTLYYTKFSYKSESNMHLVEDNISLVYISKQIQNEKKLKNEENTNNRIMEGTNGL